MKRNLLFIVFLLIFCNKLPVGDDELNLRGDFTAQWVEFIPYVTLTEYKNIPLGTSGNLVIGKNSKYESRILLKFNFPDSLVGLDEIRLVLYNNKEFNNNNIKFSIHLLNKDFDEAKANWKKRTDTDWWSQAGGDFDEDSIRFGEIKDDSLVVWFNYIELNEIKSSKGLVVIPEDSGFVNFYSKEGGSGPKFVIVKNGVVSAISANQDCHILTGPEPFYIESWLGSGMAFRNYVKFNFDTTFNDEKAVYASLTFKPSEYFSMRDTIEIGVRELIEPFSDFNTATGPLIALEKFTANDTLFDIDIVKHVQKLIEHPDSNFGIFLFLSPENYDISYLKILPNSHHLKVGYIQPPEGR